MVVIFEAFLLKLYPYLDIDLKVMKDVISMVEFLLHLMLVSQHLLNLLMSLLDMLHKFFYFINYFSRVWDLGIIDA